MGEELRAKSEGRRLKIENELKVEKVKCEAE